MAGQGDNPGRARDKRCPAPKVSGVQRRYSGAIPKLDAAVVLIVDDDAAVRHTFEQVLLRAGYLPLVEGDPRVALARCIAERPDLVLSDYSMPQMTGAELSAAIRASLGAEAPPVIIATGELLDRIPADAANLLLAKPVMPRELVAAVQRFLPEPAEPEPAEPEPAEPEPAAPNF